MLPLITEKGIALTHLIICSLHVNSGGKIHLNDYPPDDPHFSTLWAEADILKRAGIRVMAMVGGAAPGSFTRDTLDSSDSAVFEHYYGQLRDDVVGRYGLQGFDVDVEQAMSQAGIARLVNRLNRDFNNGTGDALFEVTLAPVASALLPGGGGANLSGFDYARLAMDVGSESIAFYNAQFYNGFGTTASPADYEAVVGEGSAQPFSAEKVMMGQVTAPTEGYGYVVPDVLNQTVVALRNRFTNTMHQLGGIMGWEYFDSKPGGTAAPWKWAQAMTAILRPGLVPKLKITAADATRLETLWQRSVIRGTASTSDVEPDIDYAAMVNAV